jgi:molybdopterin synthase catalytic subunit
MTSMDGVTVTLRLFAIYRERVGQECIEVTLQSGSTVADALTYLAGLHPSTLPLMSTTMVAVNQEYTERDHVLEPNDEIALIPPVSGGQGGLRPRPYSLADGDKVEH